MSDLEGSINRLGDDMATLHKCLEEMMQSLLHKVGSKEVDAGDDIQAQALYATLVPTPVLTSTAAEVKTVPPKPAPTSLLNVIRVVDVPSTSALLVGSNVAVDVAADATMNKAADHANVIIDINTVYEKIGYEDEKKSVEPDVSPKRCPHVVINPSKPILI